MSTPAQVIIAVDSHKASRTPRRRQPPARLAAFGVEVNREGYGQLRRFARR